LLAAMPERKPNQIARVAAVVALVAAFMLVTFTLFTVGNDSDGGGGNGRGSGGQTVIGEPTPEGAKALERGFWIVKEGDTLAQIAADTGLDTDNLIELNTDLDPQVLIAGQHVRLR
jgi:uncharacterized protein YdeI (BOF family)